jgi:hypothetical protein
MLAFTTLALYSILSIMTTTSTVEGFRTALVTNRHPRIQLKQQQRTTRLYQSVATASIKPSTTTPTQITVEDDVLGTRPRIVSIESAEDYKAFLGGDHDDDERLCIVK